MFPPHFRSLKYYHFLKYLVTFISQMNYFLKYYLQTCFDSYFNLLNADDTLSNLLHFHFDGLYLIFILMKFYFGLDFLF